MRTIPLVLALVLASSTDAVSQDPLQPGQRVRVTVPGLDLDGREATFQRLSGDTLVLSSASHALSDLARLDVHRGQSGHFWLGAGIGSAVGAAAGVVIGLQLCQDDWVCRDDYQGLAALAGIGIGGALGGLLGGAIGALIKTDKWEEVPLDRLRVSIVPTRRGFGLGARIAF